MTNTILKSGKEKDDFLFSENKCTAEENTDLIPIQLITRPYISNWEDICIRSDVVLCQSNPQPCHRHIHFRKRFRLLGQCIYGGWNMGLGNASLLFFDDGTSVGNWDSLFIFSWTMQRIVRPQLPLVLLHTVHFARACGPHVDLSVDLSLLLNHARVSKQPEACRSWLRVRIDLRKIMYHELYLCAAKRALPRRSSSSNLPLPPIGRWPETWGSPLRPSKYSFLTQ